jgi:hypothetical protein
MTRERSSASGSPRRVFRNAFFGVVSDRLRASTESTSSKNCTRRSRSDLLPSPRPPLLRVTDFGFRFLGSFWTDSGRRRNRGSRKSTQMRRRIFSPSINALLLGCMRNGCCSVTVQGAENIYFRRISAISQCSIGANFIFARRKCPLRPAAQDTSPVTTGEEREGAFILPRLRGRCRAQRQLRVTEGVPSFQARSLKPANAPPRAIRLAGFDRA